MPKIQTDEERRVDNFFNRVRKYVSKFTPSATRDSSDPTLIIATAILELRDELAQTNKQLERIANAQEAKRSLGS